MFLHAGGLDRRWKLSERSLLYGCDKFSILLLREGILWRSKEKSFRLFTKMLVHWITIQIGSVSTIQYENELITIQFWIGGFYQFVDRS